MQSIGDGDDTVESSSAEIMQTEEGFAPVFFDPRPLTNLLLIDELESLSPVLDMQVSLQLRLGSLVSVDCDFADWPQSEARVQGKAVCKD